MQFACSFFIPIYNKVITQAGPPIKHGPTRHNRIDAVHLLTSFYYSYSYASQRRTTAARTQHPANRTQRPANRT